SVGVLELLLARGAEVDVFSKNHGGTALWYALYGRRERACELLSRASRDVWSLTHLGKLARLREVLAAEPALANAGAKGGDVPLMYLAGEEGTCLEIAELLLAHGADLRVRQPAHGWNPAELAERRCMPRVAALLRASAT